MMTDFHTLDIIIPSFRFRENAAYLVRIAALQAPAHWKVNVFVIGDNPDTAVPPLLQECINEGRIHFHQNTENRGLNYSRNKGIGLSSGAWILVLDDDIIPDPGLLFACTHAIENHPEASGFAGVVEFPEAQTTFTKALVLAGYTYYFSLPRYKKELNWAAGANFILNRRKLGDLRFSDQFRHDEGGDEVELAIRLRKQTGSGFMAIPAGTVLHPWWNEGKPDYSRAFKYSRGDHRLLQLHPQYGVYRFSNLPELLLLLLVLCPVLLLTGLSFRSWLFFILSMITIDMVLHFIRIGKESKEKDPGVIFQTWLLKKAEQLGYAGACIQHFHFSGLIRRFDMELRDKPKHFHTNRWIWIKMGALLAAALIAYLI